MANGLDASTCRLMIVGAACASRRPTPVVPANPRWPVFALAVVTRRSTSGQWYFGDECGDADGLRRRRQRNPVRHLALIDHFRFADERPFAFAGLWESWKGAYGETVQSCTLLTTEPNELVRSVGHHRMPALLSDEAAYIRPGRTVVAVPRLASLVHFPCLPSPPSLRPFT